MDKQEKDLFPPLNGLLPFPFPQAGHTEGILLALYPVSGLISGILAAAVPVWLTARFPGFPGLILISAALYAAVLEWITRFRLAKGAARLTGHAGNAILLLMAKTLAVYLILLRAGLAGMPCMLGTALVSIPVLGRIGMLFSAGKQAAPGFRNHRRGRFCAIASSLAALLLLAVIAAYAMRADLFLTFPGDTVSDGLPAGLQLLAVPTAAAGCAAAGLRFHAWIRRRGTMDCDVLASGALSELAAAIAFVALADAGFACF